MQMQTQLCEQDEKSKYCLNTSHTKVFGTHIGYQPGGGGGGGDKTPYKYLMTPLICQKRNVDCK